MAKFDPGASTPVDGSPGIASPHHDVFRFPGLAPRGANQKMGREPTQRHFIIMASILGANV